MVEFEALPPLQEVRKNPALGLGQRRLDSLALAPRLTLTLENPPTLQPEMPAEKSFWKATTHQLKKHQWSSG